MKYKWTASYYVVNKFIMLDYILSNCVLSCTVLFRESYLNVLCQIMKYNTMSYYVMLYSHLLKCLKV